MRRGEAEDAGGLTPVKDDNEAAPHFPRRTLLVFNCFDYIRIQDNGAKINKKFPLYDSIA